MEPEPKTSVAFSDSLLLSVSVAGFCVLAVTIYKIVLSRVKSADEVDKEDLSPDELLARADVSTLNRAQRRARAKVIMKEQRRAAVLAAAAVEGEGEEQPAALAEEEHETAEPPHAQLSRKERQAAAKAAEKEERRLYQGERQKQQEEAVHAARQQKKERLAAEAARQEQERLHAARLEQERRAAWSTFLATETKSQSVEEFRRETKENRIVRLDRVAESFGGVAVSVVEDRIEQLMAEGRIAGFFDCSSEEKRFVVVSSDELQAIAASIHDQGTVTLAEIATLCERVINGGDGCKKH